jgi:hypothetical protein
LVFGRAGRSVRGEDFGHGWTRIHTDKHGLERHVSLIRWVCGRGCQRARVGLVSGCRFNARRNLPVVLVCRVIVRHQQPDCDTARLDGFAVKPGAAAEVVSATHAVFRLIKREHSENVDEIDMATVQRGAPYARPQSTCSIRRGPGQEPGENSSRIAGTEHRLKSVLRTLSACRGELQFAVWAWAEARGLHRLWPVKGELRSPAIARVRSGPEGTPAGVPAPRYCVTRFHSADARSITSGTSRSNRYRPATRARAAARTFSRYSCLPA